MPVTGAPGGESDAAAGPMSGKQGKLARLTVADPLDDPWFLGVVGLLVVLHRSQRDANPGVMKQRKIKCSFRGGVVGPVAYVWSWRAGGWTMSTFEMLPWFTQSWARS